MKLKSCFFIALLSLSLSAIAQTNGVTSYSCPLTSAAGYAKRSSLVIDNLGNKWIGFNSGSTSSCQLIRYTGSAWWKVSTAVMTSQKVNALAVDGSNNVWVGTNTGIYVFQDTNLVSHYTRASNGLLSDTISSLNCGGGKTYAGTYRGLSVFNGTSFSNYSRTNNV